MGQLKQLHIDCEYQNCIYNQEETCIMFDEEPTEPPEPTDGDYDPYFDEDRE